jgi:hypothetical protein
VGAAVSPMMAVGTERSARRWFLFFFLRCGRAARVVPRDIGERCEWVGPSGGTDAQV